MAYLLSKSNCTGENSKSPAHNLILTADVPLQSLHKENECMEKETYIACFRSEMGFFGCCLTDTKEEREVQKIADDIWSEGENFHIITISVTEAFSGIDQDEVVKALLAYLHSLSALRGRDRLNVGRGIENLLEEGFGTGVEVASSLAMKFCRP